MRWQQGRATIDDMIGRGELERVPASRDHADLLMAQASGHLASARTIAEADAVARVPQLVVTRDVEFGV